MNLLLTLLSFVICGVKILQQLTGFMDIDKINPDAWPAVVADIAAGDQGIITLAFGEFSCGGIIFLKQVLFLHN